MKVLVDTFKQEKAPTCENFANDSFEALIINLQVQRRPLYPAQVPATATGAHRLARGNILVNCVVFAIPTPCHFTIKFAFFIYLSSKLDIFTMENYHAV